MAQNSYLNSSDISILGFIAMYIRGLSHDRNINFWLESIEEAGHRIKGSEARKILNRMFELSGCPILVSKSIGDAASPAVNNSAKALLVWAQALPSKEIGQCAGR